MGCFCYFISFQSRILSKLTALKIKKRLLLNGSHSGVYYMVSRDEIFVLVKESITICCLKTILTKKSDKRTRKKIIFLFAN